MYTGIAGAGNPSTPLRAYTSGNVAIGTAATGTLLAGGQRESDGVSVNSIPIRDARIILSNSTTGALTVSLYDCPFGVAANGTGAVLIADLLPLPVNTAAVPTVEWPANGTTFNLAQGRQILAVASGAGAIGNASWSQER